MNLLQRFKGREGRNEFYSALRGGATWPLFLCLFLGVVLVVIAGPVGLRSDVALWIAGGMVMAGFSLSALLIGGHAARRMHDLGRSGWWALPVGLYPFAFLGIALSGFQGWLFLAAGAAFAIAGLQSVLLWLTPGTGRPNRHGEPPLDRMIPLFGFDTRVAALRARLARPRRRD